MLRISCAHVRFLAFLSFAAVCYWVMRLISSAQS